MRKSLLLLVGAALLGTLLSGCAVKRGVYHEVKEGQTLWRISQAYNVDLDLILQANDIHNANQVPAGSRVFIPGASEPIAVPRYRRADRNGETGRNSSDRGTPSTTSSPDGGSSGNGSERINPEKTRDTPGGNGGNGPRATTNFQPVWPCEGRIVSRFDKGGDPTKRGIMMHVVPNSDVKAMESGTIRLAGQMREPRELQQFGNLVMIFHNDNFVSVYAHLDKINVEKGSEIDRGEVIGKAGSTGFVDQSSCYFQIRYKVKPRDPLLFLGEQA